MRNLYALRWQVFNRDKFTCQYCGRAAPDVVLHVDHREPQSIGGRDDPENLVTACAACNIGKGLHLVGIHAPAVREQQRSRVAERLLAYAQEAESLLVCASVAARDLHVNRSYIVTLLRSNDIFSRDHSDSMGKVWYKLLVAS